MRILLLISFWLLTTPSFSQPVNYEVYALSYATMKEPFKVSFLVLDGPQNETVNAVFMIWVVKGDNGKRILVDAGFHRDVEEAKSFGINTYIRPDSVLARIGLRADEITDVILTHPHWDHMGCIDLFPNAQIWIQKEDFNYFVGSAWQKDGRRGGFNKKDVTKLINTNLSNKLTLVDGDGKQIIAGVTVYTGSRHTFNSQYVMIETGGDKIILASDNCYSYYNLDHLQSAPKNATFDPQGYVNAMKRMKTLASDNKFIVPGHDALLFSRFPNPVEGVARIK